ncbi:N-acetylglucosamine kinase [Kitasatospora sp. CB01950]|uniref:N-acetylglucosamine kinase n=1 Tax=Kitasatospora sp. CB01950 TaxID=1703930 RepID=UPI00093EDC04|nr:BadF/BadG/BcrA/BcrD ATPase family protein [Kitasatospora sp. CB01950]OKJ17088.1 hypothetical protein AMK19_02960 [Kitasatospora sp. CB01950]
MTSPGQPLVLGLDVGGTSTRALVATLDGRVLGTAHGAGGNPVAHGTEVAVREIGGAVRAALAGLDPARVTAAVIGLAGNSLAPPELSALWPATGLTIAPQFVDDAELAHAAGSPAADGTLLLSGTGAIAAEIRDHELHRTADGHGWLLGDRGSGCWLGREAVSAALTAVDRALPLDGTPLRLPGLAGAIAEALLGQGGSDGSGGSGREPRAALIAAAHAEAPARLARFAPVVLDCAAAGDPVALDLVDRAAGHLIDTLALVRDPDSPLPLVLAGGLLTSATLLAAQLRPRLAARWPAATVSTAGNGAGAAAWLAARTLGRGTEELHRRLTA